MEQLSDERMITVVNFSSEKYNNSQPKKFVNFFSAEKLKGFVTELFPNFMFSPKKKASVIRTRVLVTFDFNYEL